MREFEKLEADISRIAHQKYIPLLISSELLRRRNMGQIDVSWLNKGKVIVAECKSGKSLLSHRQKGRLKRSLYFLGAIFSNRGQLILIERAEEFAKCSSSAYPLKVSKIMELT